MVASSPLSARRNALSDTKRALLGQMLDRAAATGVAAGAGSIPRRPPGAAIPLSLSQQSLWFFHQLDPASPMYHIPMALRLEGPLDVAVLQQALDATVARHEMLRTRIVLSDGAPVQEVLPAGRLPLRQIDLTSTPPDAREAVARTRIDEESCQPFDFSRDTLLRALLIRLGKTSHILVLTAHHIASDGWSWGVLFRELAAHYEAQRSGVPIALRELPVQYGDFALWQRARVGADGAFASELAYWKTELAGAPALLELPTDRPRPAVQTFRGDFVRRVLSPGLSESVRALARAEGATLFTTLLAAFQVLLHRLSGQTDLVVGTAVAGRTHAQLEEVFGYFVNTLPLRSRLPGDPAFREFLRQTRSTCLEALSHQEVPFDQLVAELRPVRSPSHLPLVQVMFTLQDDRAAFPKFTGIETTRLDTTTDTAKFDLSLMISETEQSLVPVLEYNRDLFDAETARRWLGHFETLLEALVAQPDRHVSELPLLSAAERAQLVETWNDTRTDYPREATVVSLFEEQAVNRGDAIAIESTREKLTYREANRRANVLAQRLRSCGVTVDTPVAFCLERSAAAIVVLLGILKAGGTYCALDPEYPAERLAFMLQDLQPKVLLTRREHLVRLPVVPGVQVLCLEDLSVDGGEANPAPLARADSLAYICYTSGSTGKPKGVCVPHRGVVRLVCATDYAHFGAGEAWMQFAPIGFDGSTLEIWGALLHGARLVVHPPGTPSLSELGAFIEQRGVTSVFLTTGLFHALVDHALESLRGVRQMIAGGDAMSPAHAQRFLAAWPQCRLVNGYGPTENTTFTACHTVESVDGPIPIGRPIANTEAYIFDPHGEPAPIGVPGELWTGGDGLARGYLRRPELTAEKFVPHPYKPGERLYRTGDLARYRADGAIAFLGRIDRQVKLRGFRVELEEIETHLRRFPSVSDCVVTAPADGSGERRLTAHVVATTSDAEALRAFLRQHLPAHMVPSVVIFIPALPLTANGKVDLRALPPAAAPDATQDRVVSTTPRDRWEEQLVKIWESVLGVSPIGVEDRFFDLGGHSLMALRVAAQIEKTLGRRVSVTTLFQAQSIRELATVLRDEGAAPAPSSGLLALQPKGSRPPLYLVPGIGGGMIWGYINLSRHLGTDQPVYVFRTDGAPDDKGFETIEQMAARHVSQLRAFQPEGPYSIGGYCFGGNVAFEMARILEQQGQEVALLALMNSSPPNSDYYRFRWTIPSLARFTANLFYWLCYFFRWERKLRRDYVRWKFTQWRRTIAGWLGLIETTPGCGPDEIVNLSALPVAERKLYDAHVRALIQYRCRAYHGPVTLLRTRGHPLICSYDKSYGWKEFVRGRVTLLPIPGAHESLLQEPHVRSVASALIASRGATPPEATAAQLHAASPAPAAIAASGCAG